jgi:shikimate kinase
MKSCGVVITLTADIQTIARRVGQGDDRPMLWDGDRLEKIRMLLEKREAAYSKADIILDTSSFSIDEVAQKLVERLRDFGLSLS